MRTLDALAVNEQRATKASEYNNKETNGEQAEEKVKQGDSNEK